ncbi:hypothetical protein GCM10009126_17580 [Rhodanobacter caeni]|uniref:PepSY domain-containing protein n=2 Tax=Rhodanobacter caeni TaxID=657654 RepID=A0ABP3E526_9GAMM
MAGVRAPGRVLFSPCYLGCTIGQVTFGRLQMKMGRNVALVALLVWAYAAVAEPPATPAVTLDQAVRQVQSDTGGKVLSAEPHRLGRRLEYRIKVLTPEGHVRVVAVSSETGKTPGSTRSTRSSSGKPGGSKEKH